MEEDTRSTEGECLESAVRLTREALEGSWESSNQALRVCAVLERFATFVRVGFGVEDPQSVTGEMAQAFVYASLGDGSPPSTSWLHLRRSALRLLFRSLRHAGVPVGDPTLDLVLPARSQVSTRALLDDEVSLCRAHAQWSLSDSRRSSAWALAEATCRSVEIAQIRIADVDLDGRRVWIHGGRTTIPRWGQLSEWGLTQLTRRVEGLPADLGTRIVYGGRGDAATGQVSASVAIADVLTRAGLAGEPDVRPSSVAAWAGRRVLAETGRIDEAARRLGMSSLDRTARFIGFDWRVEG